jgi:predicted metal-dependent hydrolase
MDPTKVEVVRSARRRKTVQARKVGGVLRVLLPAGMSPDEEDQWVVRMIGRMERMEQAREIDLPDRAARLAARYSVPEPAEIRWVDNQEHRWGSCHPATGRIRISSRLAKEPVWVVDYVIMHELAHLVVAAHNPRFWAVVDRYPLSERARGFLIARGWGADDEVDDGGAQGEDDCAEDFEGAGAEPAPGGQAQLAL